MTKAALIKLSRTELDKLFDETWTAMTLICREIGIRGQKKARGK